MTTLSLHIIKVKSGTMQIKIEVYSSKDHQEMLDESKP